jgi:hypothetical protein
LGGKEIKKRNRKRGPLERKRKKRKEKRKCRIKE